MVALDDADIALFRTFGFIVMRGAFPPRPLSEEVDAALRDGGRTSFRSAVAQGSYVPMMATRTPVSLSLLDRFASDATVLLSAPVLPVRAKCVRYVGGSDWHTDSERDLASIGFAAYLEPLRGDSGALRVLPGSHRPEFGRSFRDAPTPSEVRAVPGYVVETDPGDVIVLDEHLYHASVGGTERRQWRVDYVVDAVGAAQEAEVRSYYAGVYELGWDGGYDADAFPTYGPSWLSSGRPYLDRLTELGAHAGATAQEAAFA